MKNEDMIVKMQEQFNEGMEKVAAAQKRSVRKTWELILLKSERE